MRHVYTDDLLMTVAAQSQLLRVWSQSQILPLCLAVYSHHRPAQHLQSAHEHSFPAQSTLLHCLRDNDYNVAKHTQKLR